MSKLMADTVRVIFRELPRNVASPLLEGPCGGREFYIVSVA